MADRPLPRSALAAGPTGLRAGTVTLTPLPEGRVLQVVARRGATVAPERLAALGDGGPAAVRPNGPGQWLVVGEPPLDPGTIPTLAGTLADVATVFDLGHGRVRLRVEGPGAAGLLATGTGMDLSARALPVGAGAPTLFGHLAVHLTKLGPESYELVVARSFAEDLWHALGA